MSDMRFRRLGDSGLVVSEVGLGCNNFGGRLDLDQTRAVIGAALDAGITLFDTADIYGGHGGSEELMGRVLDGRRDEIVLATKFGADMGDTYGPDFGARGSRRYVRKAIEGSLRRLRTDHVDLLQLHGPDPATPIGETLDVLDDLVREGSVRYVGSSNFAAWQVADAEWTARDTGATRFISAQNQWSLLERDAERELLPACAHFGIGVLPYFPLASGLLTGKYHRGQPAPEGTRLAGRDGVFTDAVFDRVEALERFAADRGRTLLDVAFGGLLGHRATGSVIAGATTPEQVRANVAAGSWVPTAEDLAALDEIAPPTAAE